MKKQISDLFRYKHFSLGKLVDMQVNGFLAVTLLKKLKLDENLPHPGIFAKKVSLKM